MLKDLRKTWTPLIRIALSSAADLAADWFFYDRINKSEDPNLEKYEIYLFVFFCVSATMCALTFVSIFIKGCCPGEKSQSRLAVRQFSKVLGLEILLEDIPQFVLTSLITVEIGALTPMGAINMATSAFNFVLNVLDICEPGDDDSDGDKAGDQPIVDDPETQPGDMNVVVE